MTEPAGGSIYSVTMQMSTWVLLTLVTASACMHKPGSDRHRVPVSGTTPVTDDEKAAFIAHADTLGCKHEPAASGEDSVFCSKEPGRPRFVWLKEGGMACGVAPGQEKSCETMWAKLNAR